MGALWDRYVAVTLANRNSTDAVKYDQLKIVFQVEKNSESNANTAKISIYNLNQRGRSLAEKEGAYVILEVGYTQNKVEQLFTGDITRAYITHQGANWLTTMECGDGSDALRSVHVDKSYAAGVDIQKVIKDVAQSFVDQGKVVIGSLIGLKSEKAQAGITLSGDGQALLDSLTAKQDLEWSIQDNTLQILPKDQDIGSPAVLLTVDTGLIGSPVSREVDDGEGVEFTALIQPQLMPGRLVQIGSRHVSGIYKLRAVNFSGDNDGGDFYAKGTGVVI